MPRVYISPNGFRVLVGKNSTENDRLSSSIVNSHDFWFHAKDIPGAHVILQWDPCSPYHPTQDDLLYAAHAAAYFSKAKHTPYTQTQVIIGRGCDLIKVPNGKKMAIQCTSTIFVSATPALFVSFLHPIHQLQVFPTSAPSQPMIVN